MKPLFHLVTYLSCGVLGFLLGWRRCRRTMQGTIDKIDAQLKLNQAKMLERINADIRSRERKNVRWPPPKSGDRSVKSS